MQLYGSRAPGGAIIITSYKGAKNNAETGVVELLGEVFPDEGRNSMRRNFNDVAFELPNIKTDKAGKATVNFTYPDNITQWNGYFIAVGNKKQQVRIEFNNTKSLLDLSARLSMPKFTIEGDSMVAIGQVVNYLSDSITLKPIPAFYHFIKLQCWPEKMCKLYRILFCYMINSS